MDWYQSLFVGLCTGVAYGLAQFIVGKLFKKGSNKKEVTTLIVFLLILGALTFLSREYKLFSRVDSWRVDRMLPSLIEKNPGFKSVKDFYPDTYSAMIEVIKNARENGLTTQEAIDQAQGHVSKLLLQKLPVATDDALISYVKTQIILIEELTDPNLCFRFLAPEVEGGIDPIKHFSEQALRQFQGSMAEVLISAAKNPKKMQKEADVDKNLELIRIYLREKFGDDVQVFDLALTDERLDRGIYCSMNRNLFLEILRLPRRESTKVLRFLYSSVSAPDVSLENEDSFNYDPTSVQPLSIPKN